MKRIIAILLALTMILTLCACGGSKSKVEFFEEIPSLPKPDSVHSGFTLKRDNKPFHYYRILADDDNTLIAYVNEYLNIARKEYNVVFENNEKGGWNIMDKGNAVGVCVPVPDEDSEDGWVLGFYLPVSVN